MGNYLDTPITTKNTFVNDAYLNESLSAQLGIRASCVSSMQGYRTTMEDSHVIFTETSNPEYPVEICAIFDGHGGHVVSDILSRDFIQTLITNVNYLLYNNSHEQSNMLDALTQTCEKLDEQCSANTLEGSTAIICIYTLNHIFFVNIGDSRGLLVRKTDPSIDQSTIPDMTCDRFLYNSITYDVYGTIDHKPTNQSEHSRITNAGGIVYNGRVDGKLALSRAFGDFSYKSNNNIPIDQQKVISVPIITVFDRANMVNDEQLVILACDGVWDVFTNVEAVSHVFDMFTAGEHSINNITEELIDLALDSESEDNISVGLIALNNSLFHKFPMTDCVMGRRANRLPIQPQPHNLVH
jgi:serine/threonine protein phosphatase PrpC